MIVSGGRGMKGPENFPMLEQLAEMLGGVVGASVRQWTPAGSTAATRSDRRAAPFTPSCTSACGISGAIQHLAGMSGSDQIVAINKDPDAPDLQGGAFRYCGRSV